VDVLRGMRTGDDAMTPGGALGGHGRPVHRVAYRRLRVGGQRGRVDVYLRTVLVQRPTREVATAAVEPGLGGAIRMSGAMFPTFTRRYELGR